MTELFNTENILRQTGLFWQYPVITEEEFYNQNKKDPFYCGIPWATLLDKGVNTNSIFKTLIPYMKHKQYYTCCQHISFRKLLPLFKIIGITIVYSPHKVKDEDELHGVKILPCPLYAVNIEDNTKNLVFRDTDFLNVKRNFLYSFMGGVQNNYISNIRRHIFTKLTNKEDVYIENTGEWHFNKVVYSHAQNINKQMNIDKRHSDKTNRYNKLLINSRYSLCPSGSGPNSIRFWESLACGSIPVLLSDTIELPYHIDWGEAIIVYPENKIEDIDNYIRSISIEEEELRRKKCIELYKYFKNNFKNSVDNKMIVGRPTIFTS